MEIFSSNSCLEGSSAGLFCLRRSVLDLSKLEGPEGSLVISSFLITPGMVLDLGRLLSCTEKKKDHGHCPQKKKKNVVIFCYHNSNKIK
jgi:hypothetical protein